jgi:hypothetical protein
MIAAVLATGAALAMGAPAAAEDEAHTTRIEPRPFYGATVTVEEGVRVFRPLPTQRHVIVNPGGMTPLSLGYYDWRVYEQSTNYNYNYAPPYYAPRAYGLGAFPFGPGFVHRGFGHGHGPGKGHGMSGTP